MYRHHPRYDAVRQLIAAGEIGELRGIRGAFTFNNSKAPSNVRFHQWMGGGSIYDVGCYPISAARLITGKEPEAVTVQAFFSSEHDHVDMMASGLIEFPGQVGLTFDCGMWAAGRNVLEILGTDGRIELPSAFVTPPAGSTSYILHARGESREFKEEALNQYSCQADDFARSVFGEADQKFVPDDAVRNMKVIDACLLSAREHIRVTL